MQESHNSHRSTGGGPHPQRGSEAYLRLGSVILDDEGEQVVVIRVNRNRGLYVWSEEDGEEWPTYAGTRSVKHLRKAQVRKVLGRAKCEAYATKIKSLLRDSLEMEEVGIIHLMEVPHWEQKNKGRRPVVQLTPFDPPSEEGQALFVEISRSEFIGTSLPVPRCPHGHMNEPCPHGCVYGFINCLTLHSLPKDPYGYSPEQLPKEYMRRVVGLLIATLGLNL